jgi:TrmH family RNA methyltransferase
VHGISPTILFAQLRMSSVKVYAAVAAPAADAEDPKMKTSAAASSLLCPWDIDWKTPSAILIGNEGAGLPTDLVRAADSRVFIPQAAATARVGIESLNAAMAASVLLYEAMRQRIADRKQNS